MKPTPAKRLQLLNERPSWLECPTGRKAAFCAMWICLYWNISIMAGWGGWP